MYHGSSSAACSGGNILTGAASLLMPVPGTPAGGTQAPVNANVITAVLSIKRILIIESNITWTKELNDMNWNAWKGSMKCIFGLLS